LNDLTQPLLDRVERRQLFRRRHVVVSHGDVTAFKRVMP
jgi:hypothetical protein